MAGKFVPRWLLALVLSAFTATADANPSPLSAEVQPLTFRPRTEAPAILDIRLRSQSRALIEGTLELEAWTDGRLLYLQRIPDLALTYGTTSQRLFLPPPPPDVSSIEEVHLQFSTRTGVHDLGGFPVAGESTASRQYLIGVCRLDASLSAKPSPVWRALRPERLSQDFGRLTSRWVSSPAFFAPEDLPSPIGLCAFDVVLFDSPALAALGPKQMSDLAAWVEGGGSVCIIAPAALDEDHIDFLNRLAGTSAAPKPFARNPNGTLARLTAGEKSPHAADGFLFARPKLGCCVISFAPPSEEDRFLPDGWARATQFLAHANAGAGPVPAMRFAPPLSAWQLAGNVRSSLIANLPHPVRMIPLPVVGAILSVFVLLVGPGEWFVLGWLRRRRWTWLTFPAVAAGATIFTVQTAEHYLGSDYGRVALVVTDFSEDGHALRENRVEMWFPARNQEVVSDLHQTLAVPCVETPGNSNPWSRSQYIGNRGTRMAAAIPWNRGGPDGRLASPIQPAFGRQDAGGIAAPAVFQGHLPSHYTLARSLSQWTPYFQRSLTFSPGAPAQRLQWEAFAVHRPTSDNSWPAKTMTKILGAEGWTVHVFRFADWVSVFPSESSSSLAQQLSLASPQSATKAMSPTGNEDLFDLRLDHEPLDWVVVAERVVGREIQVQRCVYHSVSDE